MAIDPSDVQTYDGGGSSYTPPPPPPPSGGSAPAPAPTTTTTSSSPSVAPSVAAQQPTSVASGFAGMGTDVYFVTRTGAGRAGRGPGRTIDVNETVTIGPKRSNGANVRWSLISEDFAVGANGQFADEFSATDIPVEVNVRSLNEIWMYSAASDTDALIIRVRRKGHN